MREVTRDQVISALQTVGVRPGDGLLVHSALQFLGRPNGGVGMYMEAICRILENRDWILDQDESDSSQNLPISSIQYPITNGCIAVPAFNFAFARGEAYDPETSPAVGMGAFSEFVRQIPGARRTPHPVQSLAVIGRHALDIASRDTSSAFGPGSAFERLLELDFKLLLLGADIQSVSMLHYSEQRAQVPYRYWKEFGGPYKTVHGWETRTSRIFVRNLDIDPHLELYGVQACLVERGLWHETTVNYGKISLCRLVDFVAVVDEFLAADPWSLVKKV